MWKNLTASLIRFTKIALITGAVILLLPRGITSLHAQGRLHSAEDAPEGRAAIVFGAALRRDGYPSAVLRDRLDTAIQLYHLGKTNRLLMSGLSPEPDAMRAYAISQGVPTRAILLDDGGLRTYDTCYRAKRLYGLRKAILVTQAFHLPRALYLCNQIGIDSAGVIAQESRYWRGAKTFWNIRESFATVVALWDVHITQPIPDYAGY